MGLWLENKNQKSGCILLDSQALNPRFETSKLGECGLLLSRAPYSRAFTVIAVFSQAQNV